MEILNQLEKEFNVLENLKEKVINPVKIQLHSGIEGFKSPLSYGIYRNTGGNCLGVVGKNFEPLNLNNFLDSIVASLHETNFDLNFNDIQYKEFKSGSIVSFEIPFKNYEIKNSPMVGDVIKTKLMFKTGFDGKMKTTIGFYSYRLFCQNGAGSWEKDSLIQYKNTKNNTNKILFFSDKIFTVTNYIENYINNLEKLIEIKVTSKEIDEYFYRVFGMSNKEYNSLKTRSRNALDKINESVAIEIQNSGSNMYSLLQGVTRYTTHELAKSNEEKILFSSVSGINNYAHYAAFDFQN